MEIFTHTVDVLRMPRGVEPVVPNGAYWALGAVPSLSTAGSAH